MTRKLTDIKLTEQQLKLAEFMIEHNKLEPASLFIIHQAKGGVRFNRRIDKRWIIKYGQQMPRLTTIKTLINKNVLVKQKITRRSKWDEDEYHLAYDIEI